MGAILLYLVRPGHCATGGRGVRNRLGGHGDDSPCGDPDRSRRFAAASQPRRDAGVVCDLGGGGVRRTHLGVAPAQQGRVARTELEIDPVAAVAVEDVFQHATVLLDGAG